MAVQAQSALDERLSAISALPSRKHKAWLCKITPVAFSSQEVYAVEAAVLDSELRASRARARSLQHCEAARTALASLELEASAASAESALEACLVSLVRCEAVQHGTAVKSVKELAEPASQLSTGRVAVEGRKAPRRRYRVRSDSD